jgi:hypothetical protein
MVGTDFLTVITMQGYVFKIRTGNISISNLIQTSAAVFDGRWLLGHSDHGLGCHVRGISGVSTKENNVHGNYVAGRVPRVASRCDGRWS